METVKFSIEIATVFALAQELTHTLNFPHHFVSKYNTLKVWLGPHQVTANFSRNLTDLMDPRKYVSYF